MRVALAQMDCRLGEVETNVGRAAELREKAQAAGADLIVFPELAVTGYCKSRREADLALAADDDRLARVAGDCAVIVGFAERPWSNAAARWERGRLRHVQRKLYLPNYGPWEEGRHFIPGDELEVVDGVAVLICNDAWHPALVELAVRRGAEVLVVPANSARSELVDNPSTWSDITRFYARLLQVFVVFVNRVGEDDGFAFWGGSHVVDFDGRLLAAAPEDVEAVVWADLDLEALRRRRLELPLLDNPRLDLLAAGFGDLARPRESA
ncbi:MAG: N-carbamoylputrescine amidase [Actinomycetota bacterium]|nr:N-carbamoylputrescine amidase [Actinomycetota bacterium]